MKPGRGWRARIFTGLIGLGLLIGLPAAAGANSVNLAWDRNPEPDLAGYKIHIGTSSGKYTQTIDAGHVTTFTVSGLSPGETYFFSITAYDIFANESGYSAELRASIPKAPAPAPATSPMAAAPTSLPATQADAGSAESVGGGGTSDPADGGGGSSPGVLASLLDSARNMFSADTSSTALISPSESSSSPGPASVSAGSQASPTNPTDPTNPTGTGSAVGAGSTASTAVRIRGVREREIEVERLHQQGRELYTQGKIEEAIPRLRQAAVISAGLPVSEQVAVAAHDLGVAYYAAERHTEAVRSYKKALAVYRQLENRELEARLLDHLALIICPVASWTVPPGARPV